MNCAEALPLVGALLDGELDAATGAEVLGHVQGCAECARRYAEQETVSRLLRERADYAAAPEDLSRVLEKRYAAKAPRHRWAWANAGLSAAAAVMFALALSVYLRAPSAEDRFADELVSAHVRSLQAGHLEDVLSSDKHTVKPWFAGRVDFAPPVPELAAAGFPLLGGRLDYVGQQTAAALVYGYGKHVINVFVCPAEEKEEKEIEAREVRGYHLVYWSRGGLDFWAVSDAEPPALKQFAAQFNASIPPTT